MVDNTTVINPSAAAAAMVQIEYGNKATDWSPSIASTQNQLDANAGAISSLTSRVSGAEGNITSQSSSITNLNNSLTTTNNNVTAAQNTANAKGKVLYGTTAPATADQLAQNLWIDTTNGANTPKRWNGTAWAVVTDKVASDALAAANTANSLSLIHI